MNNNIPWLILLSPLIGAVLILLFARRSASLSAHISVFAVCVSFLGSLLAFLTPSSEAPNQISWISLGDTFQVPIGLTVDSLSKVMLLIVTGIGALVHIYSLVYMADDEGKARYFAGLSLFMFSMLGIVLADNFVMMFIFWELVGVSSYILIGHWFTRDAAAKAANKAFLSNRIGDFGFMLGILLIWSATGSFGFNGIREHISLLTANPAFLTVAAVCVFCGAVGKSAQFPLHVWLPDAMEGPTPVSALIHAATMVAAGVYMLVRVYFIVSASATAMAVIAWIGIVTAVLAALIATQQDDIKRILAYSTLSQLGYMVSAIGNYAPDAAMFHLFTHAFFKALLFLGAGAVIYALHHEQNIWRMGGLRTRMPKTFWTFVMGTLALMGCFPFSGFFSKDSVLLAMFHNNGWIFLLGLGTAYLTAFYMMRLVTVAFLGRARSENAEHGHDGPLAMTMPLQILAVLSVVAGWSFVARPIFGRPFMERLEAAPHSFWVPVLAFTVFLLGAVGGWVLYANQPSDPILIPAFKKKFGIDEFYGALIGGTQDLLAKACRFFDKWVVDGLVVRGLSGATLGAGLVVRFFQFGNLQGYAFLFGLGVVALIYIVVFVH